MTLFLREYWYHIIEPVSLLFSMKFYLFLTISILFRVSRQITSQFLTFLGFFHWITQEKIENILNLQRTLQKTPDSSPQMMTPDSDSLFQKVPNESGVKSHDSWFVHSLIHLPSEFDVVFVLSKHSKGSQILLTLTPSAVAFTADCKEQLCVIYHPVVHLTLTSSGTKFASVVHFFSLFWDWEVHMTTNIKQENES